MSEPRRQPCTCTATQQPCAACRAWRERRQTPGITPRPPALAEAHRLGATSPLMLPLASLEVRWL